ncbi:dynein, axonemal, heavy chain 17 [Chelydra serpentina]|uniref:Dynein, axonemal, heavy chain 17 n=1 Tax=Chelydra serpentina TaxID=8475 RepID=A0A8T1T5M6_CHESE|nr:dynein, axonemal, heavy chain 17 [Chelydra serpentina]
MKAFKPYQSDPTFDPEFIQSKSTAAAGLCSWCLNIVRFYEVYCDVAPKRQALEEANAELAEAQDKLGHIKNKIAVSACYSHWQNNPTTNLLPESISLFKLVAIHGW